MEENTYLPAMQQAFELWINPEIERRRQAGRLPDGFILYAAQVLMDLDTAAPTVRLNAEVKVVLKVRTTRPVKKGERLTARDFSDIEDVELTDLDPNAGHLTMILHDRVWVLKFDFRYNAARIAKTLRAAKEFLECAAWCLEKGHTRAYVDNLFSATELMAKGFLLMHPDQNVLTSKSHKIVFSKYNWWGKLGNTDPRYVSLLNDLSSLRGSARYLRRELTLKMDKARDMMAVAEQMFQTLHGQVPKRIGVTKLLQPSGSQRVSLILFFVGNKRVKLIWKDLFKDVFPSVLMP